MSKKSSERDPAHRESDDVEGHRFAVTDEPPEEDTEGHAVAVRKQDEDDDTEGHATRF